MTMMLIVEAGWISIRHVTPWDYSLVIPPQQLESRCRESHALPIGHHVACVRCPLTCDVFIDFCLFGQ